MKDREFIEGIDGLRAIAAFWVLIYHFHAAAGGPEFKASFMISTGWVGVDIFFVISGFVLSLPFLQAYSRNEKYSVSTFYKRRAARILPAYYFSLLVIITFSYTDFLLNPDVFMHLIGHLTFTEGFLLPYERLNINGVYWTLWLEMQFYLILPLLMLLFKTRRWVISFVAVIALVTLYKYLGLIFTKDLSDSHQLTRFFTNLQLPGVLQEFTFGIAVAIVYLKAKSTNFWTMNRNLISLLIPLGFLLIIVCMKFANSYGGDNHWYGTGPLGWLPLLSLNTLIACGAALVLLGITSQADWVKSLFGNKVMNFLGGISYGIYIWHFPIGNMALKMNMNPEQKFMVLCLAGTLLTIAWAYVSYRFIEKPFLLKRTVELKMVEVEKKTSA